MIDLTEGRYQHQYPFTCTHYCLMIGLNSMGMDIQDQGDLLQYNPVVVAEKDREEFPSNYIDLVEFSSNKEDTGSSFNLDDIFEKMGLDTYLKEEYHYKYSDFLDTETTIKQHLDGGHAVFFALNYETITQDGEIAPIDHMVVVEDYDEDGFQLIVPHEKASFRFHLSYRDLDLKILGVFIITYKDKELSKQEMYQLGKDLKLY